MNTELPVQMFERPRGRKASGRPAKQSVIPDTHVAVLVRMPKKLKNKLVGLSRAGWRSLTSEIVMRLDASVENQSIDEHGVIVEHCPALRK